MRWIRLLLVERPSSSLIGWSHSIFVTFVKAPLCVRGLPTIKGASRIYVFGEGQLLENGTHDELLRDNGAYAHFVQSQKLKESTSSDDDAALEAEEARRGKPEERTPTYNKQIRTRRR